MKRNDAISRIEAIAESVAESAGLEIVDVELKGSGRNQLLRIFIDKPAGVTHADCELVSQQVSAVLDTEDPVPGSYQLEVSSPGVERKLKKWADWQRFSGQKVKVVLQEPVAAASPSDLSLPAVELKYFDGTISRAEESHDQHRITVELTGGRQVNFDFSQVDRANLKFEW